MAVIRTTSTLPELSVINDLTLFEVASPADIDINEDSFGNTHVEHKYLSRKITTETLMNKAIDDVHTNLNEENQLYDVQIKPLEDRVNLLSTGGTEENPVDIKGVKHFEKAPTIDQTFSEFTTEIDKKAVNVSTLSNFVQMNSSPNMLSDFGFVTGVSSMMGPDGSFRYLQLIDDTTESNPYQFGLTPNSKQIIQNEFIFKIKPGETESNVWTAPASGMFTCYGWLDEKENDIVSNTNRWVALCAQNQYGAAEGKWFILQVQPFVKNKYLSYVGFTFPVAMGLNLKIKIGFEAGSNSDKYYNVNGGLANHVANAFFGGVYTGTINNKNNKFAVQPGSGTQPEPEYATQEDFDNLSAELKAEKDLSRAENLSSIDEDIKLWDEINRLKNSSGGGSVFVNGKNLHQCGYDPTDPSYNEANKKIGIISATLQHRWGKNLVDISNANNERRYYPEIKQLHYKNESDPMDFGYNAVILSGSLYYEIGSTTITEDLSEMKRKYVVQGDKTFLRVGEPETYGKAFMDEYFYYYVVPRDGFVQISHNGDYTSRTATTGAHSYLLLEDTSENDLKLKYLCGGTEHFSGTDPRTQCILPMKAGNVIVSALTIKPYHVKKQSVSFTGSNYKKTHTWKKDATVADQWKESGDEANTWYWTDTGELKYFEFDLKDLYNNARKNSSGKNSIETTAPIIDQRLAASMSLKITIDDEKKKYDDVATCLRIKSSSAAANHNGYVQLKSSKGMQNNTLNPSSPIRVYDNVWAKNGFTTQRMYYTDVSNEDVKNHSDTKFQIRLAEKGKTNKLEAPFTITAEMMGTPTFTLTTTFYTKPDLYGAGLPTVFATRSGLISTYGCTSKNNDSRIVLLYTIPKWKKIKAATGNAAAEIAEINNLYIANLDDFAYYYNLSLGIGSEDGTMPSSVSTSDNYNVISIVNIPTDYQ